MERKQRHDGWNDDFGRRRAFDARQGVVVVTRPGGLGSLRMSRSCQSSRLTEAPDLQNPLARGLLHPELEVVTGGVRGGLVPTYRQSLAARDLVGDIFLNHRRAATTTVQVRPTRR